MVCRIAALLAAGALLVAGCQPTDPRKPEQPTPPEQPHSPAPAEPSDPAPSDPAPADPAPSDPAPADPAPTEPTEPTDPAPTPEGPAEDDAALVPGLDPDRPLVDGVEAARAMLHEPDWEDVGRLSLYCADSIARAQRAREALYDPPAAGIEVAAAFDRLSRELDTARGLAALLFQVSPLAEVRQAAQRCTQELSRFATAVSLDRRLFDAMSAVEVATLPPLAQRFISHGLRDFRRAGVDQDEATRERITAINARLVELRQAFSRNVNDDVRSIKVADRDKLAGLPEDWLAAKTPDEDGNIVITTNYPDFFPFQSYVADDALRRRLYAEFGSRGVPDNIEVLREVLALRQEFASLLGYATWADYIVEDKMAGSTATVDAFIAELETIVRPRAEADLKTLLARKRHDTPDATAIETHDRFFYVSQVQKEDYDFDPQVVRPYFSYPRVKQGVLELYAELFELEFVKVDDAVVWHPSVDAYELRSGGELVGRFFLDMHPRDNKFGHAAAFPIQFGAEDGRIPWASLVCNFPDPSAGEGQALMEHKDVVTFFHEFGHLIHHLLARRGPYIDLTGFNVEWDFVEVPSQILEEWAWDASVLARFALHVDTDEPIPAELVERMRAADEFGKGVALMRQVFFTAYSFFIHQEDPAKLDLEAFTDRMYQRYSPFPRGDSGKIYANFGHLMGYSALYYTYQWSLSIAKDMFTRFEDKGLLDRETAMAYRREILEPGGTRDAEELVRRFLGRERSLDAYRAWIQSGAPQ